MNANSAQKKEEALIAQEKATASSSCQSELRFEKKVLFETFLNLKLMF